MTYYNINTNNQYKVLFYDDTDVIIEFTNETVDDEHKYYGVESYECWTVNETGEWDDNCILYLEKYSWHCYIEIFSVEKGLTGKINVKELIEL